MARLIPANSDIEVSDFTINDLSDIQKAVGGYIEVIYHDTTGVKCLVVNEEGTIIGLPVNNRASRMLGYPLFGNVLEATLEELNK